MDFRLWEEIESEVKQLFQEMGALEGGEGGEDVSEEELGNFINSLDEEVVMKMNKISGS